MIALLVGASPAPGAAELLSRLARDSDFVIAVDGGADVCSAARVEPDVVLGDFDSVSAATLSAARLRGADLVGFPADKDETDLELAFEEARRLGATHVALTAVSGGRLDHLLAVVATLRSNADLTPELVEPESHAWVMTQTARPTLSVRGTGTVLSLLPLTGTAIVSVSGVRWPLDRARLTDCEARGVSNVVSSEVASVEVHDGLVLVVTLAGS